MVVSKGFHFIIDRVSDWYSKWFAWCRRRRVFGSDHGDVFGGSPTFGAWTSLLVVLPTAIAGSFVYSSYQQLDYLMAISLAIGAMVGAAVGAHFMKRIPAAQLKRAFGVMLFLVGLRMAW